MNRKDDFGKKVLGVVRKIPRGKVMTYKEVAQRAGSKRAYRAVGNILNRCGGMKKSVPCHRVVRSDGKIGGYRWGVKKKSQLLRQEKAV